MPGIKELGHVGLYVDDMNTMVDFYTRILGLTVTDRNDEVGLAFVSSRPEEAHHELVMQIRRDRPKSNPQQIAWQLGSFEDVVEFYGRLKEEGLRIEQVVTHGIAFGIYFYDPEDNRTEVYWETGEDVPQPFRKELDFDQPPEAILAQARELHANYLGSYDRKLIK